MALPDLWFLDDDRQSEEGLWGDVEQVHGKSLRMRAAWLGFDDLKAEILMEMMRINFTEIDDSCWNLFLATLFYKTFNI